MGRDLRGKELGEGIYQQTNGTYCAKFVDRFGKRKSKRSKKLQGVRQWLADATYINEHSDIEQATNMVVDAKDFAENTGALEYRHNYEFICSYHRRRKTKRN